MSDQSDSGSRDRATVALAVEMIAGLKDLTRAEFGEVKDRLNKLEGLPERVTRLEARESVYAHLPDAVGGVERHAADLEHRMIDLERDRDANRASWLVHWPTLLPALLALVVAAYAAWPQ